MRIAIINHKGGVGKTTSTRALINALSILGKKVLVVDADPQANLTGMLVSEDLQIKIATWELRVDLYAGIEYAITAKPRMITALPPIAISDNIDFIPGSIRLAENAEAMLQAALLFAESPNVQAFQNIPGAFSYLIEQYEKQGNYDYVIVDFGTGLSAANQCFLMSCDYIFVPALSDLFSRMALESLAKFLPKWKEKAQLLHDVTKDADYPYPMRNTKVLGVGQRMQDGDTLIDLQMTFITPLQNANMIVQDLLHICIPTKDSAQYVNCFAELAIQIDTISLQME